MVILGITGGIGCGKSYVSNLLKRQGAPVYNCDEAAKYIMSSDQQVIEQIKTLVGENAYLADGQINKTTIGEFIFSSDENRLKLNAIVHPVVRQHFIGWTHSLNTPMAFVECALLYESGFDDMVDKVVEVFASEEVRIHRIIKRDKITRIQATERIKAQMSETEKMKKADFCIINNGNMNVSRQIDRIVGHIFSSSER